MRISIHQPEIFPWLNLVNKISRADVHVLLDHVQYSKNSFINRNKISSNGRDFWLSVPVSPIGGQRIIDLTLPSFNKFKDKALKSLVQSYGKFEYFNIIEPVLEVLDNNTNANFSDLSFNLYRAYFDIFNLNHIKIIRSSSLCLNSSKSDLILEICKTLDASVYISGENGVNYLKFEDFAIMDIDVIIHSNFSPKDLSVHLGTVDFNESLCILDLLPRFGVEKITSFFNDI